MSREYEVTLTGLEPLLMHHDNLAWASILNKWVKDPNNKKNSVAGDDRTPAWRWLACLYVEGNTVGIPSDNLMTMLREGASKITLKGNTTYKKLVAAGLVVNEILWDLVLPNGKVIKWDEDLKALTEENDYSKHEEAAEALGFSLFAKRAAVGSSKHVRVRPKFPAGWKASGTVTVFEESITDEILEMIFSFGGRYSGIGDWRPSSPKSPGPYGRFEAEVKKL